MRSELSIQSACKVLLRQFGLDLSSSVTEKAN